MEKMADTDTGLILDTVNTQSEDHEGSKTALLTNNSNSSSSPRYSGELFKKSTYRRSPSSNLIGMSSPLVGLRCRVFLKVFHKMLICS